MVLSVLHSVPSGKILTMDDSQCRVCLGDVPDRISVFTSQGDVSIAEQIFSVTTVQIQNGDSLSKTICGKCCADTSTAFQLKMKCLSTAKMLQNLEMKFQSKVKELEAKFLNKSMSELPSNETIDYVVPEEQMEVPAQFTLVEASSEPTDFAVASVEEEVMSGDEMEIKSEIYEEVEYLESDTGEDACAAEIPQTDREKKRNVCELCSTPVVFKHEFSLKRHLWTFHENLGESDPMICEICGYRFDENQSREDTLIRAVQKHQTAHEKGKTLSCTFCPELFKSQLRLDQHIEEHKRRLQNDSKVHHKCRACHKIFPKYEELHSHLNQTGCRKTHENPFRCFICNISFAMGKKKKEHVQQKHQDKAGADCPLCCRCKIPSAVAFENHYRTHFEAPRFACPYCSRPFFKSDRLQTHIRRSHEAQKYECFWCSKAFHDKGGVSRHILGVHFNRRNFRCEVCDKLFTENYNLKEHLFSVHRQAASKFYTCPQCQQDFLYRAPFERHKSSCMGPGKRSKNRARTHFVS